MKRIVLSIVVLLVLLCGIAVAEEKSIVASGDCGDYRSKVTWTLDSEGTLTISGEGKMKDYSSWNNETAPWYSIRASIKTAVIEDGVTSIGRDAFYNCSSLSSISLPAGLTSIGYGAFQDCSSLKKVYVDTLEGWLNISFSGDLSNPLVYGGELFIAGKLVTDLVLPEGVTCIGNFAFKGCSSLSSITLPEGVTSIGEWAFYNCSKLSSIVLPEGVTGIGNSAFRGCSSLSSITLPEGVTSIGECAFEGLSLIHI